MVSLSGLAVMPQHPVGFNDPGQLELLYFRVTREPHWTSSRGNIDDHLRVDSVQVHADEREGAAVDFLLAAITHSAGVAVIPVSKPVKLLQEIEALQRVLCKESLESAILGKAVECSRAKNSIARLPSLPEDDR